MATLEAFSSSGGKRKNSGSVRLRSSWDSCRVGKEKVGSIADVAGLRVVTWDTMTTRAWPEINIFWLCPITVADGDRCSLQSVGCWETWKVSYPSSLLGRRKIGGGATPISVGQGQMVGIEEAMAFRLCHWLNLETTQRSCLQPLGECDWWTTERIGRRRRSCREVCPQELWSTCQEDQVVTVTFPRSPLGFRRKRHPVSFRRDPSLNTGSSKVERVLGQIQTRWLQPPLGRLQFASRDPFSQPASGGMNCIIRNVIS